MARVSGWDALNYAYEHMSSAEDWRELLSRTHEVTCDLVDFDVCSLLLVGSSPDGGGTIENYIGPADDAWVNSYQSYFQHRVPKAYLEGHRPTLLGTVHAARDFPQFEFTRDFLGARRIQAFTGMVMPARRSGVFVTINFHHTLFLAEQHSRDLTMLDRIRRNAQQLFLLHDRIESLQKLTVAADRGLTPREEQVAELAAHRLTAAEIAQRLGISRRTIETHLLHLYEKFDVINRKQLIQALRQPIL